MIRNVPNNEEMMDLAVKAYFVAWKEATSLFEWIEATNAIAFEVRDEKLIPCAGYNDEPTLDESARNLKKYEEIMQSKLKLVYSLVQHSQELALKSHICKESPYLLLIGTDAKSWARDNVDFTDLKTIDAGDLVKVVTAINRLTIDDNFKTKIEDVRRGRNSIQHLGKHKDIDLLEPIRILTRQYIELFPGRNWLRDLHASEDVGLDEIFYFSDTAMMHVLHQLSMLHRLTTKKLAKSVLGIDPLSSVYECPDCVRSSDYDHQGHSVASMERKRGTLRGHCRLCDQTFEMRRKKCAKCGCDVVFASGEGDGCCCGCGE